MTLATAVMTLAVLAGCGSDGGSGDVTSPTTTPSATLSEAPPVDADDPAAVDLWGDWEIPAEDYVLHLVEDGTFIQDYMGVEDFRTGKFSVEGDTITLVGDDGDNDEGTIVDDTLEFTLGTATRVK
ncbi:MAG: hypothetical protein ABWX74_15775 [Aeromicrobium sp.]